MGYFLCTLVHGRAWDDRRPIREQDGWDAHATFMDQLVDDGVVIVGGPVGTGDHTAHLMRSDDASRLRERLADDPWARDGHLQIGRLEPWSLWLDGRHLDQHKDRNLHPHAGRDLDQHDGRDLDPDRRAPE